MINYFYDYDVITCRHKLLIEERIDGGSSKVLERKDFNTKEELRKYVDSFKLVSEGGIGIDETRD